MAVEGFSGKIVVGLRLHLDGENGLIRVQGTVESFVGGRRLYEEKVEYVTTWAQALAFLGTLLSGADAERTVAAYLASANPA